MSINIHLQNIVPRLQNHRFLKPIEWKINSGQNWAVIGENGSGKSLLIDILLGKYALLPDSIITCVDEMETKYRISNVVKSVAFNDIYSIIDTNNSYYQQRWNKGIVPDKETAKVYQLLSKDELEKFSDIKTYFDIDNLLEKEITLLSSGELRKFLIIRSLLSNPKILILDNPYIGLDAESRELLSQLFEYLAKLGIALILLVPDPKDIPTCITHVLGVKEKKIVFQSDKTDFFQRMEELSLFQEFAPLASLQIHQHIDIEAHYEIVTELKSVNVKYGERTIFKNLNWKINKGDKWTLLGANGSGKSTLLSLICGDNPQAYANDIWLFDKKRGTGESIWDIKKQIGYISPEMHLYYLKNIPCIDVVASGLFDTIGLYRKCNESQLRIAQEWMRIFAIEHLTDASFLQISTGEQRLVLLARTFVKSPNVIILDEPMHGLDVVRKKQVINIIKKYCENPDKTIIYVTHYMDEIPVYDIGNSYTFSLS